MVSGRLNRVRPAGVAVAAASCLAVAACSAGGASSAAHASQAGAAPSASSTPDPLASLTANQIAAKAFTNLKAAPSVTMDGTLAQSGTDYVIKLGLRPGHGCAGTIATSGQGSFKIIVIGKTVYLDPDDKFWTANGGSGASTVIALVAGRYIKTTTANKDMASLSSLCDLSQTLGSLTGSKDQLTRGKPVTLGGVRVLPLKDTDGSVAYVTDTSKPELVQITAPKGSSDGSGTITFSVGAPVTLTAPPASQVIDGSLVGL
jgi:hypothetical protein